MRIETLERRSAGDRTRIKASYVYEESSLPPVDVYYEAGPPLADFLEATPEAFGLPGFPLALWEGERRLQVDGALDAKLADGLTRAGALLSSWYDRCGTIQLEPTKGLCGTKSGPQARKVALMSGGVDAMAMLVENRQRFPLDHPNSIRTVLCAFGFSFLDRPKGEESPFMRARYEAQARRIEALGARVGFDVIRLDTNVRQLNPGRAPFYYAAMSGAFLAPLIASPGYVGEALMASPGERGSVQSPHGSHPLLDVEYSTGAVRVRHGQPQMARLDKLRMIADYEPAHDTLQVCHGWHAPDTDVVNCGRCEKCIRTMVGLLICRALPRFTTFPLHDVSPDMIDRIEINSGTDYLAVPHVLNGLAAIGRDDLVSAIEAQIVRSPIHKPTPRGRWHRRFQNVRRRLRRLAA